MLGSKKNWERGGALTSRLQSFEAELLASEENLLGLMAVNRELFPRVGFIVTSMTLPSRSVVRFYNKRGTAEQWIKEGKQATHWTRLSCHRFRPTKCGCN